MSLNRLHFSLASLVVLLTMMFAVSSVMAAPGGPTVEITKTGTPTRAAYTLKFTFNMAVEDFDDSGDVKYRYYDANDTLLGSSWEDAQPVAVSNKPAEYTLNINV